MVQESQKAHGINTRNLEKEDGKTMRNNESDVEPLMGSNLRTGLLVFAFFKIFYF